MKKIIIGNWKLNLDHLEANQLLQKINYSLPENIEDKIEIILSPSFTSIRSLQTVINSDKLKIKLSSQNVSQFASGAYTGEVSATQLKKLEIDYGIVGHSERRTLFNEIDLVINDKVNRLIENDIVPVFCFGEPIEERNSGSYLNFIENQISNVNPHNEIDFDKSANIIIHHVLDGIKIAKENKINVVSFGIINQKADIKLINIKTFGCSHFLFSQSYSLFKFFGSSISTAYFCKRFKIRYIIFFYHFRYCTVIHHFGKMSI